MKKPHSLRISDGFGQRGSEVARIQASVDAAFAFAETFRRIRLARFPERATGGCL